MQSSIVKALCIAAFMVVVVPARAQSAEQDAPAPEDTMNRKPLTWAADVQLFAGVDIQKVLKDSAFNPQNRVAGLTDDRALIEMRPDFSLAYGRFSAAFGPRLLARPSVKGDLEPAHEKKLYVNRWRVKAQLSSTLKASYGREVLQWGNGVFRSPGNPFLVDNGRLNPIQELPGQEFAVVTYTPLSSYAFSFISNTRPGHRASGSDSFRATNALKVDYVGKTFNATIVGSKEQGNNLRLGGAYTYSASEAILVYGEATAARGSRADYPEPSVGAAGWRLAPLKETSGRVFYTNLLGVSYTALSRLVTTVEYLHNNEGYTNGEAAAFSSLARSASDLVLQGGASAALGAQLLGQALNTGLRVERRNYVFVQVLMPEYRNRADIAISYARAVDAGGGGTFSGYSTFSIKSRTQLFAVASYNNGPANSEFARLQRFTLSAGVRLFFNR